MQIKVKCLFFKKLLLSITTILSINYAEVVLADDSALLSIKLAQQAYLNKDGKSIFKHIKNALEISKNHPMILKNVLKLYKVSESEKLFTDIKPDWSLPPEIKYLTVSAARRYNSERGKVGFFMTASGQIPQANYIEQFQVIRYPNEIVLDKSANIGNWKEEHWGESLGFWTSSESKNTIIEDGLYLLNIKVKDKNPVQAWFILNDASSSASPVINLPKTNQEFITRTPSFIWKNFRSPESKNNEDRIRVSGKIRLDLPSTTEDLVSVRFDYDPKKEIYQFKVGDHSQVKEYKGPDELPPGPYSFSVYFHELQKFGDLWIGRNSSTKTSFQIISENNK